MDCHAIIKELAVRGQPRSQCYALIKDIKQALSVFASYSFNHVGRSCNELAHGLAVATRTAGDQEIFANVPEGLGPLMVSEYVPPVE